jgi:exonuclease III
MKNIVLYVVLVVLLLVPAAGCSNGAAEESASGNDGPELLRIGTWNLEWFGAYGRSDEDLELIADIIDKEMIDVLNLQEITCECTLEKLAEILEFEYFISPQRVPQKLALLYNPNKVESVTFEKEDFEALERVAKHGMGYDSRQPLVFTIKSNKFDFKLVNVHLKSNPENSNSVEIRNIQYDTLNQWLEEQLDNKDGEKDIIIAGDFNSYNYGISSERLVNAGHVSFITDSLPSNEYSNIWYRYYDDGEVSRNKSLIDHFAITDALKKGEYSHIKHIKDWDKKMDEGEYEERVSDHLPLIAVFKATQDRD